MADSITEHRTFTTDHLQLENGAFLENVVIAYRAMGTLSSSRDNVVLITHGNTSGPQMLDPSCTSGEGIWSDIVGPGKAIDTDRFYVICPNMLGSSYGSTNASSINSSTNRPYGSEFPEITVADIVTTQKLLVDSLEVKELITVAGPSYGGFQAFQWAVSYPDFMRGIVAAVSSPVVPTVQAEDNFGKILAVLSKNPVWNNGNYYGAADKLISTMTNLRIDTLKKYGHEQQLAEISTDNSNIESIIKDEAVQWAKEFDANSLLILARALLNYNILNDADKIKAKVLYALSSTDKVFSPKLADMVMPALIAAGVDAEYLLIESELGHMASGDKDAEKWISTLRRFVEGLV